MAREVTVSQAAEATGYTDRHIRRLARAGKIEARQVGNWLYLVGLDSLLSYIEKEGRSRKGER